MRPLREDLTIHRRIDSSGFPHTNSTIVTPQAGETGCGRLTRVSEFLLLFTLEKQLHSSHASFPNIQNIAMTQNA
jgi:hypothetical protein